MSYRRNYEKSDRDVCDGFEDAVRDVRREVREVLLTDVPHGFRQLGVVSCSGAGEKCQDHGVRGTHCHCSCIGQNVFAKENAF